MSDDTFGRPAEAVSIQSESVRYVKNGPSGRWWQTAKARAQIHAGWPKIPHELLNAGCLAELERVIRAEFGTRPGATQDFNALKSLLDKPSQHVWITFEDGCLWWCTTTDEVSYATETGREDCGHFWLSCDRPWSNRALNDRHLIMSDLPGVVTATAGFRATVCEPKGWKAALRIIRGEVDPLVSAATVAREAYEKAILAMVQQLGPKDFELLVELLLARMGWVRIATLGGSVEGIDVEAENAAIDEIAFVQVKSTANQTVLDDYIARFSERRDRYQRMIFAVHTSDGISDPPVEGPVQLWADAKIAALVVQQGLGRWVENRL